MKFTPIGFWFIIEFTIILLIAYSIYKRNHEWKLKGKKFKRITFNDLRELIGKAQVFDLREKTEYEFDHIKGVRNLPIKYTPKEMIGIRTDKPVYVVAFRESDSVKLALLLEKKYPEVSEIFVVTGHITDYEGPLQGDWTDKISKIKM